MQKRYLHLLFRLFGTFTLLALPLISAADSLNSADWLDTTFLLNQVHHYGSIGIFMLLAAGILALPIPEETLLLLVGLLAASHKLNLISSWLACMGGALFGITLSYGLGRTAGQFTIIRLLKKLGMQDKHVQAAHDWFERVGKWSLLVGYFIPGVRHFTGLIAGTTKLHFRDFALFAYSGAIIWSNCFFWLGYHFGLKTINLGLHLYNEYGFWLLLPIIVIVAVVCLITRK